MLNPLSAIIKYERAVQLVNDCKNLTVTDLTISKVLIIAKRGFFIALDASSDGVYGLLVFSRLFPFVKEHEKQLNFFYFSSQIVISCAFLVETSLAKRGQPSCSSKEIEDLDKKFTKACDQHVIESPFNFLKQPTIREEANYDQKIIEEHVGKLSEKENLNSKTLMMDAIMNIHLLNIASISVQALSYHYIDPSKLLSNVLTSVKEHRLRKIEKGPIICWLSGHLISGFFSQISSHNALKGRLISLAAGVSEVTIF